MTNLDRHVLIVGGGVIGVACAYYLNRAGFQVTVMDKGRIGGACSHGNCGLVCPSHVLPLAGPGAFRSALKALVTPRAAFRIRPRLDPALWRWLWRFARRCNRTDMLQSGRAIQPLLSSSMELYQQLMKTESLSCEWQKRGLLFVYQSPADLEKYAPINALLDQEFGESAQRLNPDELHDFEPALRTDLAGAWYFQHDAHLRPDRLLSSWREILEQRGVRFVENTELIRIDRTHGVAQSAVADGQRFEADEFIVATGAWTPKLSAILGHKIPIEPGKGYSLLVPRTDPCPETPMIFPEHHVAVTPMEAGIRLGSIMEFAGYDESILPERLEILTNAASQYLLAPVPTPTSDEWYGWRPMTFDSTPVIGPCPGESNIYLATGHNMLGLSMAPATGKLITELVTNSEPHIPIALYCPTRF